MYLVFELVRMKNSMYNIIKEVILMPFNGKLKKSKTKITYLYIFKGGK